MNGPDPTHSYYPTPSVPVRLAGIGAIAGAILWPLALLVLANTASGCVPGSSCPIDGGSIVLTALGPVGLAIGVMGLERRAPRTLGLADYVGDLTLGVTAALFLISLLLGSPALLGPGLLLLLIGSVIFGIAGYFSGSRPRMASALVAIGAGGTLLFLVLGALGGGGAGADTPSLFALLLFSFGWAWLGVDLLLARPLVIQERADRR
jgi:hypothetical protein